MLSSPSVPPRSSGRLRLRRAGAPALALCLSLCLSLSSAGALAPSAMAAAPSGTPVTIGGLTSNAPARWKESPPGNPMRVKQFMVPREKGDAHDAEVVIFFFGQNQGGAAGANIDRWKKMFEPPAGKTIEDVSKVDETTIGKSKATILDVRGTYQFKASPMSPEAPEPRANHRMLAVVFESPQGSYFFRFVGPEKTVEKNRKDFDKWLKGFK